MTLLILKKEFVGPVAELKKKTKINPIWNVRLRKEFLKGRRSEFEKGFLKGRGSAFEKRICSSIELCIWKVVLWIAKGLCLRKNRFEFAFSIARVFDWWGFGLGATDRVFYWPVNKRGDYWRETKALKTSVAVWCVFWFGLGFALFWFGWFPLSNDNFVIFSRMNGWVDMLICY